ncbi:MAG: YraN family protein [Maricaulaceae bacterium]
MSERRNAEKRGRRAETTAAMWLRVKGWRLVEKRARTPQGEIDLIMARGRTLAMIEVKERADPEHWRDAVTPTQTQRIAQAAAAWLSRHPDWLDRFVRFDVVLLAPGRWPLHVPDAWRLARDPGMG